MTPSEIDYKIKSKSSIICVGSSNAGKSTYILEQFIANASNVFTAVPTKFIYIYTVWQEKFKAFKDQHPDVTFTDSLENLTGHLDGDKQTMIIIDDCQNRITNPKALETIEYLFMCATNHLKLTLVVVLHTWSVPRLNLCLNQVSYVFFFRTRDVSALIQLNKQSFPYVRGFLVDCYRRCTSKKYTPMIIDFHCDNSCPYARNSILPSPESEIYFPSYAKN